jgi:hypothetical protein
MGGKNGHELVLLDQAGQALAEARSLEDIKSIRDKAEAVRKYAQSASLGLDVQNRAAEVKLRAERQAGKLLAQLTLRGGDRRSKSHSDRLKLVDLGLTSNQSKRWQLQARVPENVFREHVKQTCRDGKELTSAGLMRLAKRLNGEPLNPNGHTVGNGKNGRTTDGHATSVTGRPSNGESRNPVDRVAITEVDEAAGELRNHHQVLHGILRPLYCGEVPSLRPAELRMLRYLVNEMSGLIERLGAPDESSRGYPIRDDRAAS